MKRNKIAMLLAMALTVTQSVAVPVAAEELTADAGQEVEMAQDDADTEVAVEADEGASEEVFSTKDDAEAEIQEGAEETQDVDFTAGDDILEAEEAQETFSDGVGAEEKKYDFYYEYAEGSTGNGAMLPNSEMRIQTHLMDATDDNNWKDISSYELKIQSSTEAEDYTGIADVTVDGTDIVVKTHDGSGFFAISANLLINGQVVYTDTIYFSVSEYVIIPENITDANGNAIKPEVGDKVDIVNDMKPQLVRYDDGKGNPIPVTGDNYKIVISSWSDEETGEKVYDYDNEGWKWIDVSGQELPILERTSEGSTWFALTAMEKDENGEWSQIARRDYHVDSLHDDGDHGDYDDENHGDDSEAKSFYELQIDYEDTIGNGAMLPNSEMTITTDLVDKRDYSVVNNYRLEIVEQSKFGEATVTADGKNLLMKSGDNTGDGWCYVSVQMPDGSGGYTEAFKKDVYFQVSELMLVPQSLNDQTGKMINPAVGESVNLAKFGVKLVQYKDGKGNPIDIDDDNIKIVISSWTGDYDNNAWELEEVEGQDLPIVTRKSGYNTWIALTAMEDYGNGDWEQIARKIYRIDSTVEKHSHTMDAGTIVKKADCTDGLRVYKCTSCDKEVREVLPGKGHTEVKDAGVEATCESEGKTEGSHCSVCGRILKAQESIPAKGHTEVKDAGVEATCESEGKTEGSHCSVCGKVLKKQETVPAKGHTEAKDAGVEATCESEGKTEGSHCSVCGKVLKKQETVPAKGHTEVKDAGVEATCESEGKTEGSHCSVCGKVLKAQEPIPAKGHTEVKDAAVAPTCTTAGKTEGSHCSVCGKVIKAQQPIPAKGHTVVKDAAVAPTVFADGKTEGSHCSVCGTVIEKQNTIAKVPATIYLTDSSLKMKAGQSTTAFKATGFSEGDYLTTVTSNKPGTVKVTNVNKNGTFKLTAGKKAGSAVITVTLASKKTASFKVTVQKAAVKTTKITTTTKSLTLAKGATYKNLASSISVTPVTSKEKVTYSSSNKKVATVSSKGVIKAKKAGTTKITVKSGKKKVVVIVKVTGVKTTNLSGVPAEKTVSKGKAFKIKATATPKNTDEKITYRSSNKKIVSVTSKGVVKGLKKGTATITVQSGSRKMTCKVTVK